MRLPRRVPWSSINELDQICSCIYGDESDFFQKEYAINRISAWKAVTTLPHALESTLALLVVIVQDNPQTSFSSLLLRQSFAIAILRFVNGLVDPLQVGTYARPISAIAHQLGIPPWLVELRHAATHEGLPSLNLLREAAKQSLIWLLHNYFLPTLNPPPIQQENLAALRPLAPTLTAYKNTMKTITRDVSLVSRYKPQFIFLLRDLERWIAESKITANVAIGEVGWADNKLLAITDSDLKETWALGKFCEGLAEKGMLVPLGKKKRQPRTDCLLPSEASISLWSPLLQHIRKVHTDFPYILCRRFVSLLLEKESTEPVSNVRSDSSYHLYLACWVNWAIVTWQSTSSLYFDLRKDTLTNIMQGLGCDWSLSSRNQSATYSLLEALSSGHTNIEAVTAMLLRPNSEIPKTDWDQNDLLVMNSRYATLQASKSLAAESPKSVSNPNIETRGVSIPGWRVLTEANGWKPCPIGIYHSN
ncbi:Las1-like-domain-containing protein [Crassisporium funariophilum]|nr:Las1-like-domain-containing protein [Crassisporium funariophilum]